MNTFTALCRFGSVKRISKELIAGDKEELTSLTCWELSLLHKIICVCDVSIDECIKEIEGTITNGDENE